MVKVGRFDYTKSTKPEKKLMVIVEKDGKKRTIHFGARSMGHFKDKTGIWKSKDHGDKDRRKSFRARMSGIIRKDGKKAVSDPMSPAYHALRILW
jgi:hypothetical protein|tara:strand:- start:92 stop:376 length:285 start_codon:yes stop_codon:yes gene_type:complete